MRPRITTIPEEYVFFTCERFIRNEKVSEIADWLENEGFSVSREQIYPLIRRGISLGFIKLCPPTEMKLSRELSSVYPRAAADIQVLNVTGPQTMEHLALAGAEKILMLVKELGKRKAAVHIGIGGGRTAERVSSYLALLLRSETRKEVPKIVLHALSSGFSPKNPITAPVAFFSFFRSLQDLEINYVGLFSEAMVPIEQYEEVKERPGVREAFAERKKIDIVVTSLAASDDPDGQFNELLRLGPSDAIKDLRKRGWIGDVQWRPYSEEGPIVTPTGIRSVTLFELDDLVRLAQSPRKHVILVGSPSLRGKSKGKAIRPLLEQPNLRVFNHLILDVPTATDLLAL